MAVLAMSDRPAVLPYVLLGAALPTLIVASFYVGASLEALQSSPVAGDRQALALLLSAALLVVGLVLLTIGLWRLPGRE